jgi:HSP20 family protein
MNGLMRWQRPELSTWAGFGRLFDLRDEIDRLFDAPLAEFARSSQLLSGWTPALDLYEDKDNIFVRLELPGMKKEDIELSLHEGSLSIAGERKGESKSKDSEVYRAERLFGRFQRTVSLPSPSSSVLRSKMRISWAF